MALDTKVPIKPWNSLPIDVKNLTVDEFKKQENGFLDGIEIQLKLYIFC